MSGGEPSSIKRIFLCAAGLPFLSWLHGYRAFIFFKCGCAILLWAGLCILEEAMYQALYRKYRPQTFDDVVGQMAVTQTLKTQLQSGRLSHAYLFTGSVIQMWVCDLVMSRSFLS